MRRQLALAVIADDLTGANDTGVQFAGRGARTVVPLDWHDLAGLGEADVLVLNTASRALAPAAAARRVRAAAEALKRAKVEVVYKKIDSTIRGNIGAELEALLGVFPSPLTILTPAFPPAGRAVREGILLVHGTPVHLTSIGTDPVTPVRESHLPTLLAAQLGCPVHGLPLAALRGTPARLAATLRTLRAAGPAVIVADAETPEDLARLGRLILREPFPVAAGSAGLGLALSEMLRWRRRAPRPPAGGGPVLLVVGSPNPVSLEQIDCLAAAGAAVVSARLREVLGGRQGFQRELERAAAAAATALAAGHDAILTLAQGRRRRLLPAASGVLSTFLGRAAARVVEAQRPGGLVLCGGDIAISACQALGARGLELLGEVEPGVPWGRLVGGRFEDLPAATKAGGFGTPQAFVAAVRFLRGC